MLQNAWGSWGSVSSPEPQGFGGQELVEWQETGPGRPFLSGLEGEGRQEIWERELQRERGSLCSSSLDEH